MMKKPFIMFQFGVKCSSEEISLSIDINSDKEGRFNET